MPNSPAAPAAGFMWDGAADVATFANYCVQPGMDPGNYTLSEQSAQRCAVTGMVALRDYRSGQRLKLSVRRIIELAPPPPGFLPARATGALLRLQHHFRLIEADDAKACVDLWHLLQLPAGAVVGARVRANARPVPYFNAGRIGPIEMAEGFLQRKTDGQRSAKFALRADDVISGPYSIREYGETTQVFRWNIPRPTAAIYVNSPPGQTALDQLNQFWDGFGFCEAEYHTPGVSLERPEAVDASELLLVEQPRNDRSNLEILRDLPLRAPW